MTLGESNRIRLQNWSHLPKGVSFQVRLPPDWFGDRVSSEIQQLDKPPRLAFFGTNFFWGHDPPKGRDDEDEIRMLVWDIQKGGGFSRMPNSGPASYSPLTAGEYVPRRSDQIMEP